MFKCPSWNRVASSFLEVRGQFPTSFKKAILSYRSWSRQILQTTRTNKRLLPQSTHKSLLNLTSILQTWGNQFERSCNSASWAAGPDGGIVLTERRAKKGASLMHSAADSPPLWHAPLAKWISSIVAAHNSSVVRALIYCGKGPFITWASEEYCMWQVCNASV